MLLTVAFVACLRTARPAPFADDRRGDRLVRIAARPAADQRTAVSARVRHRHAGQRDPGRLRPRHPPAPPARDRRFAYDAGWPPPVSSRWRRSWSSPRRTTTTHRGCCTAGTAHCRWSARCSCCRCWCRTVSPRRSAWRPLAGDRGGQLLDLPDPLAGHPDPHAGPGGSRRVGTRRRQGRRRRCRGHRAAPRDRTTAAAGNRHEPIGGRSSGSVRASPSPRSRSLCSDRRMGRRSTVALGLVLGPAIAVAAGCGRRRRDSRRSRWSPSKRRTATDRSPASGSARSSPTVSCSRPPTSSKAICATSASAMCQLPSSASTLRDRSRARWRSSDRPATTGAGWTEWTARRPTTSAAGAGAHREAGRLRRGELIRGLDAAGRRHQPRITVSERAALELDVVVGPRATAARRSIDAGGRSDRRRRACGGPPPA